ncbi:hypothetical protein PF008_g30002 [Phytophthora fragariae]|uniref:Uncharacterized protein n=1 Tax=Phytophthora fragariae TaxID=53985 RepID=A0A6G0Q6S4_9STRA|nr:hypothetical protein PF008_g30002 [Phytophthora fragariae]
MLFAITMLPRYVFMQPNDRSISTLCQLGWTNAKQTRSFMSSFLIALVFTFIATFTVNKGNTSNILSYVAAVLVLAGILMLAGIVGWVYAGHELDVSKSSMCGTFDDEGVEGYMYKKLMRKLPYAAFTSFGTAPTSKRTPASSRSLSSAICVWTRATRTARRSLWAGKSPNQFGKAVTGLAIAIVGIFSGGTFEAIRRNTEDGNGDPILDGGSSQPTNDITWGAAAVPNYIFIGLAECLTNVLRPRVLLGADVAQSLPSDNLDEDFLEKLFFAMGAVMIAGKMHENEIDEVMSTGLSTCEYTLG